jgi:hypothetical protein
MTETFILFPLLVWKRQTPGYPGKVAIFNNNNEE